MFDFLFYNFYLIFSNYRIKFSTCLYCYSKMSSYRKFFYYMGIIS